MDSLIVKVIYSNDQPRNVVRTPKTITGEKSKLLIVARAEWFSTLKSTTFLQFWKGRKNVPR